MVTFINNQLLNLFCPIANDFLTEKRSRKPACIPYVSEYNDCNEYTTCTGCNQCRCNAEAQWSCYKKRNSCSEDTADAAMYDDGSDDNTVGKILKELADKEREERGRQLATHKAPLPVNRKRTTEAPLLGLNDDDVMKELQEIMRGARSLKTNNNTHIPIKFHHTVDEINEDTLKNTNISGTLGAQKKEPERAHRRAGVLVNSTNNPLQIEYNNPTIYNNHITDNKIDTYDALVKEKLHDILNYTQNTKDKDLSKLVVNELKRGSETIGDKKAPVTTNITFTPEKDTLTAMAFIAGNLLNKLWNLERDTSEGSFEADREKNQKIADLLDLFKEPLTYRQEIFLKEALEQLSTAVNKNKGTKNISLCETMDEIKDEIINTQKLKGNEKSEYNTDQFSKETAAGKALSKLNEVLDLIKKYEAVRKNVHDVNHLKEGIRSGKMSSIHITKDENSSLTLFGKTLEKITNLLIPNKNSKIKNKIRNQNILSNTHNIEDDVKKVFNIDLDAMKLNSQDKLVLDYIKRLQSSPCLSSKLPEDDSNGYKQSDILFNLSEFFKIKSYSDLLKLVEPAPKTTSTTPTTTTTVNEYPVLRPMDVKNDDAPNDTESNTLSVNDKLKLHLKAIVNDLIEIERRNGNDIKPGGIDISDALPCILNMLNQDKRQTKPYENNNNNNKAVKTYSRGALLTKVKSVLEAIKKETRDRNLPQSRRNMESTGPRPKSAIVWERVIKNLNQNKPTRRFLKTKPSESYDVVKKMMDQIESNSSSTFKTVALNKEVPVSGKLTLLKTLLLNTGNYANILAKLLILSHERKIPDGQLNDIIEFVNNAASNFDLNAKVVKSLEKTKENGFSILSNMNIAATEENIRIIPDSHNNAKTTRKQAFSQLIKNRVSQYLRVKESESATDDFSYELGQRILRNLERGNDKLALELYKILTESKQREKNTSVSKTKTTLRTSPSVINLERPKKHWVSDDLFLSTLDTALANIKTV